MGKLIYRLVYLQMCLPSAEYDAVIRVSLSVCCSYFCEFRLHSDHPLGRATRRWLQQPSLRVCPPWGNEGHVAFPLHLLAFLGSKQEVISARVEVAELYRSPLS